MAKFYSTNYSITFIDYPIKGKCYFSMWRSGCQQLVLNKQAVNILNKQAILAALAVTLIEYVVGSIREIMSMKYFLWNIGKN